MTDIKKAKKKTAPRKKKVVKEIFGEVPEIAKSDAELLGLREGIEEATILEVEEIPEERAVNDALVEIEAAQEKLEELIGKKKDVLPRCGHINAHSNGVDGKPDGLTCTRSVKHSGNHSAMHLEKNLEKPDATREYEVEWSNAVDLPAVDQPASNPNVPGWVAAREPSKYVEQK